MLGLKLAFEWTSVSDMEGGILLKCRHEASIGT